MNTDGYRIQADLELAHPIAGRIKKEAAMAIYEYRCVVCKKPFEIIRPISERRPKSVKCPKCKGMKVERQWSRVSIETSSKS